MFIINVQWCRLALYMGEKVALKDIIHVNLIGTFVESITPSNKAGGEVTKGFLLKSKLGLSTDKAAALVVLQKTISITVFIFLNIMAIIWFIFTVEVENLYVQVLTIAFGVGIISIILIAISILYTEKLLYILFKIPIAEKTKIKIRESIFFTKENLINILKNKKAFKEQIILSLIIWLLFPVKAYLIAQALSLNINFISIGMVTYLTYMVGMLPLLPGGIGTVEGSTVFFLLPLGIGVSNSISMALILRFVTFWFVFFLSAIYVCFQEIVNVIKVKYISR